MKCPSMKMNRILFPLFASICLASLQTAHSDDDESIVPAEAFLKTFDVPDDELDRLISIEAAPKVAIRIHFETDSAEIKGEHNLRQLDELGKSLSSPRLQGRVFSIEGHSDKRGDSSHNMKLSQQRSQAVVDYLATKYGIETKQLQANGQGEFFLIDPGDSDEAHRINRRVEIILNGRTE